MSAFARAADNKPIPWSGPWPDFAIELTSAGHKVVDLPFDPTKAPELIEKEAKVLCPMFSPAVFSARRAESDVTGVYLFVADYDHITIDDVASATIKARSYGWSALAYSAWSNSPENVSVRLVVPLSRPVSRLEWPSIWARLVTLLGGKADPQCKDPSRGYFLPSTTRAREPHAWIRYFPGGSVDVDAIGALALPAEEIVKAQGHGHSRINNADLRGFLAKLRRSDPALGIALAHAIGGEPFAEPGSRDETMYRLAGELAKAFPEADPKHLAAHFSASVSQWTDFTLEDVEDKIRRRLTEQATVKILAESAAIADAKNRIMEASGGLRTTPYTEQEVEAEKEPGLKKRWILQKGRGYWFYLLGKGYYGPFLDVEATRAAHTYLAPTSGVGTRLSELTDLGRTRPRTINELMQDYGQIAVSVTHDLNAQKTQWNPAEAALTIAPCPRREIEPAYDERIDLWLRELAGPLYPFLELWLSYLIHTDKPIVALFMEGPSGAGKSLLAHGVSRIWTKHGPSKLTELVSDFNASVTRCPVAFADESMPIRLRGQTAELREIIQSTVRPYSQKFLPLGILEGAFRIVVAANNRSILEGEDSLTVEDIKAIAGRILHVTVPQSAEWWKQFFKAVDTTGWVSGDKIAAHALYLAAQHPLPDKRPRFLIDPPVAEISRTIAMSTTASSAIAHWLISFVLAPNRLHVGKPMSDSSWQVLIRDGQLFASTRTIVEYWETYQTGLDRNKGTVRNVSKGLAAISEEQTRVTLFRALRPRLYRIRVQDLIAWAEAVGLATEEEIKHALLTDTKSMEVRAN